MVFGYFIGLLVSSRHAIFEAIPTRDFELVKRLFRGSTADFYHDRGGKIDAWYKSPLHLACEIGHLGMVRYFLEYGADPEGQVTHVPRQDWGRNSTPLSLALKGGHREVVQELVTRYPQTLRTPHSFCSALEVGDVKIVEQFLQAGISIHPVKPTNELRPLHSAIVGDNLALAQRLIEMGASTDIITRPADSFGRCWIEWEAKICDPLLVVAKNGRNKNSTAMAELLLKHGARITQPLKDQYFNYFSVLDAAVLSNNIPLVEILLQHVPLNGNLVSLGNARSPQMIKVLLQHGGEMNSHDSLFSPLQQCIITTGLGLNEKDDEFGAIEFLVRNVENINATDENGLTALSICCSPFYFQERDKLRLNLVNLLLTHGADLNVPDEWKITALHRAAGRPQEEIVEALLLSGADIGAQSSSGRTPLHAAVTEHRPTGRYEYKECNLGMIKLLLKYGADPSAMSEEGVPALHFPPGQTRDVTTSLLDLGADPRQKNFNGHPILVTIAHQGEYNMANAQRVLAIAPDAVNLPDYRGWTPLMAATDINSLQMVKLLVSNGAEINAVNQSGQTVLDQIISWSEFSVPPEEIVQFLVGHGARRSEGAHSDEIPVDRESENGEFTDAGADHE